MIDVHTHVVPPQLPFGHFPGDHWPRVDVSGDRGDVYMGTTHFRTVTSSAWDLDRRGDEMVTHGVDRQVLSPMPELFCYWAQPPAALAYSREMNAWLAERVRETGGRFDAFGIVPLQDPDGAAAELATIAAAGLRGVQVGSNVNGIPLHDPRYAAFFAEAERLGVAVFVHAFHPHGFDTITGGPAASGVTFPNEIGFAAAGLVAEGVLLRHPRLRVCMSHGAGSLGLSLPRMDRMWDFDAGFRERLPIRPSELARRMFVDLLVFAPQALEFVLQVVGDEQVVVGSDYPFMPDAPGEVLRHMPGLSETQVERIRRTNALALLGDDDA